MSLSRHHDATTCRRAVKRFAAHLRDNSISSRIAQARAEHAENVAWSKQPDARAVLEQPPFVVEGEGGGGGAEGGGGSTAASDTLGSLDAYLEVATA